ncbi:MAG: RING finger protein, partial [Candidatus Hodarchaeales archaeon]
NLLSFIRIITKKDPQNSIYLVLRRLSQLSSLNYFPSFTRELFHTIISENPNLTLNIIDGYDLTSLIRLQAAFLNNLNYKEFMKILINIVPYLKTKNLRPTLLDQCLRRINQRRSATPILIRDLLIEGKTEEYSPEGKKFLTLLISNFLGKSNQVDVFLVKGILNTLESLREPLLNDFFSKVSRSSFENILNNSSLDLSGKEVIRALTYRFSKNPPDYPEKYYISLYQKTTNEEIKRAILPLIGDTCSWTNLPFLMELPERNIPSFKTEYLNAISNFSRRFEISSPEALVKMWSSGLQTIYSSRETQEREGVKDLQTFCPKCNNPILEGQKSCGFCVQQLTCTICLKSIVNRAEKDLIRCPSCSNFFHRNHLIASVKMRGECPICRKKLSMREVRNLESFFFLFQ